MKKFLAIVALFAVPIMGYAACVTEYHSMYDYYSGFATDNCVSYTDTNCLLCQDTSSSGFTSRVDMQHVGIKEYYEDCTKKCGAVAKQVCWGMGNFESYGDYDAYNCVNDD